jgi:hypothetical protein
MIDRMFFAAALLGGHFGVANAQPASPPEPLSPIEFLLKTGEAEKMVRDDPGKYEEGKRACRAAHEQLRKEDRDWTTEITVLECLAQIEAYVKKTKEACEGYERAVRAYQAAPRELRAKANELILDLRRRTIRRLGCTTSADGKPSFDKKILEVTGFLNPEVTTINIPAAKGVKFSHELTLNALMFRKAGWTPRLVEEEVRGAAKILAQCNVALRAVILALVDDEESSFAVDFTLAFARPIAVFEKDLSSMSFSEPVSFTKRLFCPTRPAVCGTVRVRANALNEPLSKKHRGIMLAYVLARDMGTTEDFTEESGNIFAREVEQRGPSISPDQCTAIRQSSTLKTLGK